MCRSASLGCGGTGSKWILHPKRREILNYISITVLSIVLGGQSHLHDSKRRSPRVFLKGGDLKLNPGERHSRDTRDDGTVTLCTLRAATVLSRDCRADFGRPSTKKVMSHSRDGPGVTAPSRTNIVPLTGVWNPPPPSVTPLYWMSFKNLALKTENFSKKIGRFSKTQTWIY